jgi:hypothetical protein
MANPVLPLDGIWGDRGLFRPTLIPNFDRSQLINGSTTHMSPAAFAAANPRTAATVQATVGGTAGTGDVATITLTYGSQTITKSYTLTGTDTTATTAEELAELFNADPVVRGQDIYVQAIASVLTFNWGGPVGNNVVASQSATGSLTITLSPSNGVFSGGAGPIYAAKNFNFTYNGTTMSFYYGEPYVLGADLVSKMVTQGMPIV